MKYSKDRQSSFPRRDLIRILHAFVDLGVIYPITAKIEGVDKTIAYDGKPLLSEWWLYNKQIGKSKSQTKEENDRYTSERIKRLFRQRKRKFKDAVRKIAHDFIERCYQAGVDTVVMCDMTGIRENEKWNNKADCMVHNYWSHKYLTDRIRWTVENYGIAVELIDERGTSSICPRCGSEDKVRRGRLFKCKDCGLEEHRDTVGAINISFVHQGRTNEPTGKGSINRVMGGLTLWLPVYLMEVHGMALADLPLGASLPYMGPCSGCMQVLI